MSNPDAPADLRILMVRSVLTGSPAGDALENLISNELPDGALCFVASVGLVYVFRRGSTTAANGTTVVAPIAGPGRWFALPAVGPGAGDPLGMVSFSLLAGTALGSPAAGAFVTFAAATHVVNADNNLFTGLPAGTLQYTGTVPRRFAINGTATLSSAAVSDDFELAIFRQASGGPNLKLFNGTLSPVEAANDRVALAINGGALLSPGDVLSLAVAPRTTGGAAITLFSSQLVAA